MSATTINTTATTAATTAATTINTVVKVTGKKYYSTEKYYSITKNGDRWWQMFVAYVSKDFNVTDSTIDDIKAEIEKIQLNENNAPIAVYWTEYSYDKPGSKLTISTPTFILNGKNKGKKNETTPFQQACNDVISKLNKKIMEGYKLKLENKADNIKIITQDIQYGKLYYPMASHNYNIGNNKNKIVYPVIYQDKFNGMFGCVHLNSKCFDKHNNIIMSEIAFENVEIYSRALKVMNIKSDIIMEFVEIFKKFPYHYFVGEWFKEGKTLQDIISEMKNPDKGTDINFIIFDCYDSLTKPSSIRVLDDLLSKILPITQILNLQKIKIANTKVAKDIGEMNTLYEQSLKNGYEGGMIRNMFGLYEASLNNEHRSYNIQKLKPRFDEEFEVVECKCGKGKELNAIIFIMKTDKNHTFSCTPNIPTPLRIKLYKKYTEKPEVFINKQATIEFDEKSKNGIPLRCKLLQYRDITWDELLNN